VEARDQNQNEEPGEKPQVTQPVSVPASGLAAPLSDRAKKNPQAAQQKEQKWSVSLLALIGEGTATAPVFEVWTLDALPKGGIADLAGAALHICLAGAATRPITDGKAVRTDPTG
jgi:hypothetical protein